MMENVEARVTRVIAEHFHVANERITGAATLDGDLGGTSLDLVEVVMSLEEEFKIDIFDDQASRLHTVADILACVMANVESGARARPEPLGRRTRGVPDEARRTTQ